jgi:hypothetical protein
MLVAIIIEDSCSVIFCTTTIFNYKFNDSLLITKTQKKDKLIATNI